MLHHVRLSLLVIGLLVVGLAVPVNIASAGSAHATSSPQIAQHLAVPAYINPTADPTDWNTLLGSSAGTVSIAVANVLNGPDYQVNSDWTDGRRGRNHCPDQRHASENRPEN
jgi:hypothetical protein